MFRSSKISVPARTPISVVSRAPGAGVTAERIRMTHVYLPKLDSRGLVEASKVWEGDEFERIVLLIELLNDREDDRPFDWP